jgi:hypothetical protein
MARGWDGDVDRRDRDTHALGIVLDQREIVRTVNCFPADAAKIVLELGADLVAGFNARRSFACPAVDATPDMIRISKQ